jgi:hypothetical protein
MAFTERQLEEVKFEKPGTIVEGRLLRAQMVKFDDGNAIKYILRSRAGKLVTFMGTTKINLCLHTDDIGKIIQVEYIGQDATRELRPGMSAAKLFRIAVDDASGKSADPATITDDDIPF